MFHFLKVSCFLFLSLSFTFPSVSPAQNKFKAIIFDCDGVLVDTEYLKFQAWKDTLKKHKIHFTLDEYSTVVGKSSEKILDAISKKRKIQPQSSIIIEKDKQYHRLQKKGVPPLPAAIEWVHFLVQQKSKLGIKLALASSAGKEEILENLKQIHLSNAFDLIISGKDDLADIVDPEGTNKPKPYIYTKASKMLQVAPSECLVFEDSEAGVEAAAQAGMVVIALPNILTKHQDFSKANQIFTLLPKPLEFFEKILKN